MRSLPVEYSFSEVQSSSCQHGALMPLERLQALYQSSSHHGALKPQSSNHLLEVRLSFSDLPLVLPDRKIKLQQSRQMILMNF